MKAYRILVGIPTAGSVEALTVQSLVDLLRDPVQVKDSIFHLDFAGCLIGPYVQWNVGHLFELMRRTNEHRRNLVTGTPLDLLPYAGALRIDSDMSWTREWLKHFFISLAHLLDHGPKTQTNDPGAVPWALGGVYPRRQPLSLHVPVVAMYEEHPQGRPGPVTEREYLQWAWSCYEHGATVRVGRIGGGFTFYSEFVAEIDEMDWTVTPGEGEDYALCRAISLKGGRIYGCWPFLVDDPKRPIPQGAQLYHGIGHELHTLECYFKKAREAGMDPEGATGEEIMSMRQQGRADSIFEMRDPSDES